jgi:methyl-accepting chemotaxis protein
MQGQLVEAIGKLQQAALSLSSPSEQLVSTFSQQRSGTSEQAASLNQTSTTTEELARSASQIAESAANVATVAELTLSAALAGERSSELFSAAMVRMRADNQAVADAVVKLNKRVQQIGKVVEFINEIADKSDLLALNAELEGTKAGEVGRGFSLVAAEMRRLAETVIRSTHEIAQLIEEIRDGTNAAVMATESGLKAMDAGTATAGQVMRSLESILAEAARTSEAVRAISLATRQQEAGTDQLATSMAEILRITQESGEATEEIGRSNAELSDLAGDLKLVVDNFRLAEAGGGARDG